MTACNTQHLDLPFKELLHQFYSTTIADCKRQLEDTTSADADNTAYKLRLAFESRLATQGGNND